MRANTATAENGASGMSKRKREVFLDMQITARLDTSFYCYLTVYIAGTSSKETVRSQPQPTPQVSN